MKGNPRTWSRTGAFALVTVLSTAALWGCKNNETPDEGLVCEANQEQVQLPDGSVVCRTIDQQAVDPCAALVCAPLPGAVATVAQVINGTQCQCIAQGCQPTYELQGTQCIQPGAPCAVGFIRDDLTQNCVPDEAVSCFDVPASPLCIPTRCDEQPTSRDGQDLRTLGKCVEAPAPVAESCVDGCHNGIEDPHPWFGGPDLTCTGCHGGNPDANSRGEAHVGLPNEWRAASPDGTRPGYQDYWQYITLYGVEREVGGLEWLRFKNPGDLRVVDQSCGKSSGCHMDRAEHVKRSVMATEVGLVGVAQQRSGVGRPAALRRGDGVYKYDSTNGMTLGLAQLDSMAYDPTNPGGNPTGSVQAIQAFTIFNRGLTGYDQKDLLRETFDKQCGDCHLGNNGQNNRYADFRSSGCSSCHMPRALDGRARTSDPLINKREPSYPAAYAQIADFDINDPVNEQVDWLGPEQSHPIRHLLTRQMAAQRCGTCHVGSNRTDWQYRGYQIDPNRTAVAALANGDLAANQVQFTDEIDNNQNPDARYHGQAQNQVLRFIDWNADGLDDIPADIHYQAGLECMDCHTTGEMHNEIKLVKVAQVTDPSDPSQVQDMSGALWSHQDQATEVECVHCHGNLEYRALPYSVENRNPVRNLLVCAEPGEVIPNYERPVECDNLGNGRFLRSKFYARWHYVPQTYDTVNNASGVVRPDTLAGVYTLNSSIFHGRFNDSNTDGVGPCADGNVNNCFRDQLNNQGRVTQGFSHLGRQATSPVDQHQGGLECYACHSTWSNNCFGCHLRLIDTDGNNNDLRDYARSTGELTLGFIAEADFTYISPLDTQYGINSEGKIAQFLPETKMLLAHTDVNNEQYFGDTVIVNDDANIQYNIYRDRMGYGTRRYDTEEVGLLPRDDGLGYEEFAQMDNNAGQGANQFMPHTVQRSHPLMDCNNCHINLNQDNTALIQARFYANPNGFGNVSDYLNTLANTGITRNNSGAVVAVNAAAGYRFDQDIDPDGYSVDVQADWCVLQADGFPLCYNSHPFKQNTYGVQQTYRRDYPQSADVAGPLNSAMLNEMFNDIIVDNQGVLFRGNR